MSHMASKQVSIGNSSAISNHHPQQGFCFHHYEKNKFVPRHPWDECPGHLFFCSDAVFFFVLYGMLINDNGSEATWDTGMGHFVPTHSFKFVPLSPTPFGLSQVSKYATAASAGGFFYERGHCTHHCMSVAATPWHTHLAPLHENREDHLSLEIRYKSTLGISRLCISGHLPFPQQKKSKVNSCT